MHKCIGFAFLLCIFAPTAYANDNEAIKALVEKYIISWNESDLEKVVSLVDARELETSNQNCNDLADKAARDRQMVLTFDDLPYQSSGNPHTYLQARRVTNELISALASNQTLATVFVNESNLTFDGEREPRVDLLKPWLEYGAILGNHTNSHVDLNQVSAEEYEREIINGEQVTLMLTSSRKQYPRFFRHPYTHTGDTKEKKERIASFLHDHNYQIAPYTIDSQDSVFNRVYLDAKRVNNNELAVRIQDAYVDFVSSSTEFAETISVKVFGEEIPQTIIFHANDISADTLVRVLDRLTQRGYQFVNLTDAMEHSAYKTQDKLVTSYGPSWLWRWMKSKNMDVSFRGDPEPPGWILDAYNESNSSQQ